VLKTATQLQAWARAVRGRKQLKLLQLAQRWFARLWRRFFDRKYLRPLVAVQRRARQFVYGRVARRLQAAVARPWLARRRSAQRLADVHAEEAARRAEEDAYVGRAVLVAVGAVCDAHAGKGAFQGVQVRRACALFFLLLGLCNSVVVLQGSVFEQGFQDPLWLTFLGTPFRILKV
jgi:hypothetical protein